MATLFDASLRQSGAVPNRTVRIAAVDLADRSSRTPGGVPARPVSALRSTDSRDEPGSTDSGPKREREARRQAGDASVTPRPRRFGEIAYTIDPRMMIDSTLIARSTSAIVSASVAGTR